MQISRRAALLGATAAAVVTGGTVAPLAIKSTSVKTALAAQIDPVAALVRKATAYDEWLNTIGDTIPEDEFNVLCALHSEMEIEIRDAPSTSIEGIAGKVRIAWVNLAVGTETIRNGPDETFAPLDPRRFVWSALQDLERLAGEARS